MNFILAFLLLVLHGVVSEDIIAKTPIGSIKGLKASVAGENFNFYEFKGIRYAKPPTGPLRFKVIISNTLKLALLKKIDAFSLILPYFSRDVFHQQ